MLLGFYLLARRSFHPWPVSFCCSHFFASFFFLEFLSVRMVGTAGAHSAECWGGCVGGAERNLGSRYLLFSFQFLVCRERERGGAHRCRLERAFSNETQRRRNHTKKCFVFTLSRMFMVALHTYQAADRCSIVYVFVFPKQNILEPSSYSLFYL